jgi:hypothetical protein
LAPPPPQRAAASQLLRAGPPASATTGTQCLRCLPRHAPSRDLGAYDPGRRFDARLLTFRVRAADQDHAAYTPGTAWPTIGSPPGSSRRDCNDRRFRCRLRNFRRFTSARPTPRALLERLPDPHLTGSYDVVILPARLAGRRRRLCSAFRGVLIEVVSTEGAVLTDPTPVFDAG